MRSSYYESSPPRPRRGRSKQVDPLLLYSSCSFLVSSIRNATPRQIDSLCAEDVKGKCNKIDSEESR